MAVKSNIKTPAKPAAKAAIPAKPATKAAVQTPSKALVPAGAKPAPHQMVKPAASREVAAINMHDIESLAGAGMENVTQKDVVIPRITILQKMSPQLDKKKPEYIEGAEVGDFCDVAQGKIFRGSLTLIPCAYERVFIEWAPRSTGKGMVRNHGTDDSILNSCEQDEKGRWFTSDGNYIAETATFYCLNLSDDATPCFIPLASTQLKAARRWMTRLTAEKLTGRNGQRFTPPLFYRAWDALTTDESNNDGDWNGWKFEPGDALPEMEDGAELLAKARTLYEQATAGKVKGDIGTQENANEGTM